jgi:hypothetical protein
MLLASKIPVGSVSSADPAIRFGLMERGADGSYRVFKETTRIPLVSSDPEFRFGFDVHHDKKGNFVGYVVLHVPASAHIDTTFGQGETPMTHGRNSDQGVIKTERVEYVRDWWGDFRLDDDSDVGDYRLDIFIDDTVIRSIQFEVIPDVTSIGK